MEDQSVTVTESQVLNALRTIKDPDLHRDIVTLGFVQDVKICAGQVAFKIVLTTPACPVRDKMRDEARNVVQALPGVTSVDVQMDAKVGTTMGIPEKLAIPGIRNILVVGSGKGGVGKSTVTANLAISLARLGAKVGLMDGDIYGPNIPLMMGITEQPMIHHERVLPVVKHDIKVISMGFFNRGDTPVIWRGPMLHSAIQQFLKQVEWGELDYLLVDLPPGTGDVQLTLVQSVPLTGAVVVSTPQDVALQDARKAIMMFKQMKVEVLGIVENMSYFSCPHCHQRTDIFSHGGARKASEKFSVPFLGEIPLDLAIREGGDTGQPITVLQPDSDLAKIFSGVAEQLAAQISISNFKQAPVPMTV
ncbi:MAG: Mrp/NBP35 family ATP-binding protein [Acidobacteriia bacterium]|nr:Mrp/NBP35 family ATP-binding protein [Terriglobia bacterium]